MLSLTRVVQGLDLAAWVRAHIRAEDDVTLVMDLGGAEHAVLAHLLAAGALPLADRVLVHWHTQHLVRPSPVILKGFQGALPWNA